MLPSFDSGEDAGWLCGPDEGFGIGVCLGDEAIDGGLEIVDRPEYAALETPPGEFGEETLDSIKP